MNDEIDITPLIDTGYVQKVIQEGQNAVFKNGRLVYIILDVDKPGKFFFDLRTVFNASTGEGGKDLKIMFMNNAVPWQLNGKTIGISGKYPSGVPFTVTGSECQANSSLIDFQFPLGLFQEAGIYKFQFEIRDESGNLATSHYCFFQVTQNATLLAADYNNGVNPFDSDYTEWKSNVDKQLNDVLDKINTYNDAADQTNKLMTSYIDKVNAAVDNAWNSKLSGDNTWTGHNNFTSGVDIGGNATLPSSTTIPAASLKNVGNDISRGLFTLEKRYTASTTTSENTNGVSFLNGVTAGTAGNHYMSFQVFRYEIEDGSTRTMLEIHANCAFPSNINGKPIVQFPSDALLWDGIDQTPFVLGKWIVAFTKSTHTLDVLTKVNSTDSDQTCLDARMI